MSSRIVFELIVAGAILACNAPSPAGPTPSQSIQVTPTDLNRPSPPAPRTAGVTAVPLVTAASSTPSASLPGPRLNGCPLFPADNIWNTRIDTLPLDPRSDSYVRAMGPSTALHPDFGAGLYDGAPIGIPYMIIPGATPPRPITFDYADESDPGPYPIPASPFIEGGAQSDGDRHILLVDKDACRLIEIYHAFPQADGSWKAGSGAIFDLNSNQLRPDGWTSADAAGLPILPGLVRADEVMSGEIRHALRFTAEAIRDATVWPARHHATCGDHGPDDQGVPPMGQRFRLKASVDISRFSKPVQVILTAMKRYGVILADCGSNWYISGAPDEGWNNDDLVASLGQITGADFEAVDTSGLMVHPNSAQAQLSP